MKVAGMKQYVEQSKKKSENSILWARCLPTILVTGLLMGCATNAVTVSTYRSQIQCIDGQQASAQFVKYDSVNKSALVMSLEPEQSVVPTDDLDDKYWFLKVAMGQQKSAGFGLALNSEYLSIDTDKATVSLQWIAPAADSFSAQVITAPCIYLQLEKGSYQQLEIVDQNNEVRFMISTP